MASSANSGGGGYVRDLHTHAHTPWQKLANERYFVFVQRS
ncbi:hypothetical protein FOWG_02156 [Fusarium oxysporum f. sp. lycopersici MN25]|nr:hypothetical protein FOWG_02156 [Fusarium oxysporum f. sp. lycopersici MN25]